METSKLKMAFYLNNEPILSPILEAYPFQSDAFQAVKNLDFAAIFHEQGLGKTKIGIDVALNWLEQDMVDTVFIVSKKSLIQNWLKEITDHAHIKPHILSENRGSNIRLFNAPVQLYLLNYEVISTNLDLISEFLETCKVGVILDESQKIKNPESKLTKSFIELAPQFYKRVIMTGTPVANRPPDIWSQIYFLDSGKSLGKSFKSFKKRTDLPKDVSKSDKENSEIYAKVLSEIWKSISPFTVRETKDSSGIDLPSKTISSVMMKMEGDQASIYANYLNELRHELIDDDGNLIVDDAEMILKLLLRLIQCASNPAIIDNSYSEQPIKPK